MPNILRLYLDQMFNIRVYEALNAEGHNVLRASEIGQERADDKEILQKAIADNRILITLDEHFGDWVILLLRNHRQEEFKDHLVIVSEYKAKWIMTAL